MNAKFAQDLALHQALLDTDNAYLEEGNTWGGRTWDAAGGKGADLPGQILMETIREQSG